MKCNMGQYNKQRMVEKIQYPEVWTAVYSQSIAHVRYIKILT